MSNVLVFVEHAGGKIKRQSLAAITFGQQAAAKTGGALHLVVVGADVGPVAQEAAGYGAAKVHVADNRCFQHPMTESYTRALEQAVKAADAKVVGAAATSTSKDVLPRLAGRLNAAMASDVVAVVDGHTFKRPMWAGNVVATVELTTAVKVCSVRSTEFDAPAASGKSAIAPLNVTVDLDALQAKLVAFKEVKSTRPDLAAASRIVSGGRGAKGAEGFKLLGDLADALGAGVGATRAACDAGWVPNDLQIGQTGKVVAPDLYIGAGISGAIQHLAGMKGSKVIVAINKDPEAPIFQVADYGLVADLFQALPEITKAVKC